MPDYEALRADVAALVAKPGPVTRSSVQAVLAAHPPAPVTSEDEFDDSEFDPTDFG